ncbi:hypothetical protein HMPREF0326_02077 [Desulfovibrio sp. 3_1_syn3]|nr:hypothetical protein HMPREF0326_02077 [Desulfovibrio sp. 3_1_syn3]
MERGEGLGKAILAERLTSSMLSSHGLQTPQKNKKAFMSNSLLELVKLNQETLAAAVWVMGILNLESSLC